MVMFLQALTHAFLVMELSPSCCSAYFSPFPSHLYYLSLLFFYQACFMPSLSFLPFASSLPLSPPFQSLLTFLPAFPTLSPLPPKKEFLLPFLTLLTPFSLSLQPLPSLFTLPFSYFSSVSLFMFLPEFLTPSLYFLLVCLITNGKLVDWCISPRILSSRVKTAHARPSSFHCQETSRDNLRDSKEPINKEL